jgi:hypothetical protein
MNRFWFRLMALLVFATGLALGTVLPGHVKATQYTYYVASQPGTNSETAILTCGWHDDCTTGTDGNALDWQNSSSVYWRSLSSNSQGISWVGRVYVANQSSGTCYRTYAELRTPLGTSLEGILFRHTSPSIPPSPPYVWSGGAYPAATAFVLGSSVNNDCGIYPAHVHQERSSSNWAKNSYFPTRALCDNDYGCQSDNVWGPYHSLRTWYASGY